MKRVKLALERYQYIMASNEKKIKFLKKENKILKEKCKKSDKRQ